MNAHLRLLHRQQEERQEAFPTEYGTFVGGYVGAMMSNAQREARSAGGKLERSMNDCLVEAMETRPEGSERLELARRWVRRK